MWVIRALFALIFAAAVILIDLPLHLITWLIERPVRAPAQSSAMATRGLP